MTRRIVVVGGGISGLAAAHRLIELEREQSLGIEVILEAKGDAVRRQKPEAKIPKAWC